MAVCTLQEIKQLDSLRKKLGLEAVCNKPGEEGKTHYVVGYCQGLFNQDQRLSDNPAVHTMRVRYLLEALNAPMPSSHELFVGLKPRKMSLGRYINQAMSPLSENGRVPVIITQYDPAKDRKRLDAVFSNTPLIGKENTKLVRMQLGSEASIKPTAEIIRSLYDQSVAARVMPNYWPLIQADGFKDEQWNALKAAVGSDIWEHVTVAATPFTAAQISDVVRDNVAVYQFFIGAPNGVHADGTVELNSKACVGNGLTQGNYNVFDYAHKLGEQGLEAQVGIVCGQSIHYPQYENVGRVEKYLPLLRGAAKILWDREI